MFQKIGNWHIDLDKVSAFRKAPGTGIEAIVDSCVISISGLGQPADIDKALAELEQTLRGRK